MTAPAAQEHRTESPVAPPPPLGGRPKTARPWHLYSGLLVATAVALSGVHLPWLVPFAGVWLLLGLPCQLLFAKLDWPTATAAERLVYALVTAVLLVMIVGLGLNTLLPHVGVDRPLARVPVVLAADAVALALLAWRRDRWRWGATRWPKLGRPDQLVLAGSVAAVLGSVAGANRLNNGAGGGVSLAALAAAGAVFALLFAWRARLRPGSLVAAIYLIGLALLLLTSLRGWYVTGHDVQREFGVFQLTSAAQRWDVASFRDPYNACLSITVLPTMLIKVTRLADPYVYKALFQLLFAATPVCVYLLARRFGSTGMALLATLYFLAFPTFFSDLPFLDRQEIAFLFLGAALLLITNAGLRPAQRSRWFVAFGVGMVVSHYSTTYVFVGVLLLAWLALALLRLVAPRLPTRFHWLGQPTVGAERRRLEPGGAISLRLVVVLVGVLACWSGPVTHTGGQAALTLRTTVHQIVDGPSTRSTDVSYSLFSPSRETPQQRLDEYAAKSVPRTAADRARGTYPPLASVDRYPTPVLTQPTLPLTGLGRAVDRLGIDVVSLNRLVRQLAAKLIQLLMGLGLLAVLLGFRRRLLASPELTLLALASGVVVLSQVVLPAVSADYGVLRSLQQALFCLAPFLALGTVLAVRWLGRWAGAAAAVIGGVFFASLTGLVPQLLGGYPPQLQLNNAGQYYDVYYVHGTEVSAVAWLRGQACSSRTEVQSEVLSDRLTFGCARYAGAAPINDIYPTLLRQDTYVFLGEANVRRHQATAPMDGDIVTYRYPTRLLDATRNLVYANQSVAIYR